MAYVSKYSQPQGGARRPGPTAPQFTAQPEDNRRKGGVNTRKLMRIIGFAIIIVIVATGAFMLTSAGTVEKAKPFVRDAAEPSPAPSAASIFTEERIADLRGGNGMDIEFVIKFRDEVVSKKRLELPKWNRLQQWTGSHPARDEEVKKFQEEFAKAAETWSKAPTDVIPAWDILTDISDGISKEFHDQIVAQMENVGLKSQVAAGMGVEVFEFRFGAADFRDYRSVEIAPNSKNAAGIDKIVADAAATATGQSNTSLAAGLFNALGKNQGKKFRTAVVFSDGLQNGRGADFYGAPPTDSKQYEKILETLENQGGVKCPDLSGVWVYWYSPRDEKHASQIRAAMKFWRYVLEQRHAIIKEMEY